MCRGRSHIPGKVLDSLPASVFKLVVLFVDWTFWLYLTFLFFRQCEICGKEGFINSVTLQNHVRSKHSADRPYNCEYCPAKFATSESLSHHRSSRHGVNAKGDVVPKKMYPCNRCGKLLTSRLKLMKHIEVLHEGKRDFKCKFCEKSFGSKSNLQIHEGAIHTGVLPYKCDFCGKM